TEVIVGFWLATIRYATTKVRSCDGMQPAPTLRIANGRKTGCGAKTSLCVKKSIRLPCSKRSLEPVQFCRLCYRASPKSHRVILRSSSRAKLEQVKSWLHAPYIEDQIVLRARSLV